MVCIKEIMHIYRPYPEEQTASAIALDNSLRQFFGNSGVTPSMAVMAESKALWMALGMICPERTRLDYKARIENGEETVQSMADALELELNHANALLTDQYLDEIALLLN